MDIESNFSLHL